MIETIRIFISKDENVAVIPFLGYIELGLISKIEVVSINEFGTAIVREKEMAINTQNLLTIKLKPMKSSNLNYRIAQFILDKASLFAEMHAESTLNIITSTDDSCREITSMICEHVLRSVSNCSPVVFMPKVDEQAEKFCDIVSKEGGVIVERDEATGVLTMSYINNKNNSSETFVIV